MPQKPKHDRPAGAPGEAGNAGSAENTAPARPWTAEEMAAAKPYPLPTVDTVATGRTSGVPHAGKGETEPAGRPEDDEKTAG
jgi:hypothetical protein